MNTVHAKTPIKFSVTLLSLVIWLVSCAQEITPEHSCNFVMNAQSQRVSWKKDSLITIGVQEGIKDEKYLAAIEQAIMIWEESLGYEQFDYIGVVTKEEVGDLDIRIIWDYDWNEEDKMEQAKTLIKWRGTNIYSATIGVNEEHHDFFVESAEYKKVDLVALMVHEIGHAMGLAHTEEHLSVMLPELATNYDARRIPTDVDMNSVSCEY